MDLERFSEIMHMNIDDRAGAGCLPFPYTLNQFITRDKAPSMARKNLKNLELSISQ